MSYAARVQNAHKLFDRVTKRNSFSRTSVICEDRIASRGNHPILVDPLEYSKQNDGVISWTSKISSLVRKQRPQQAISLFREMLMENQKPNFVTVLSVIKAIGEMGLENMILELHGLALKLGFVESEMSVVTALIGAYSAWDMEVTWKLFNEASNKDVVFWSAMISACVKNGESLLALELFREMQSCGMQPNHVSIVSILPACAKLGALKLGEELHGFSIKRELHSHTNIQNSLVHMYAECGYLETAIRVFRGILIKDLVSWRSLINGCLENKCPKEVLNLFSQMRSADFALFESVVLEVLEASSYLDDYRVVQELHSLVLKTGYITFVSAVTKILQVYAKFGDLVSARVLFDELKQKDIVAWSAMVAAYAQSSQPCGAFDIFIEMQLANQKPNEVTFVSLLQACCTTGAQGIGQSIHAHVMKMGYSSNSFLTSALIDMYSKFGRVRQGKAVFHENPTKDLICWSSMINGYGTNGLGDEALDCFSTMLSTGIKPNDIVFISVLSACSHCGLEYEGWNWFHVMEKQYGITPKLAHYACMMDMLSRQGNIEEALEFINKMPIEPDKRIWGALLAGCRKTCGSTEISEYVAKQLISLDPENTSYYVFLSNLYAEQGKWDEVEKLRKFIDKQVLKKEMGYSVI